VVQLKRKNYSNHFDRFLNFKSIKMGKGRKRGAGPAEDQFGEIGGSQDRHDHAQGGRGGGSGRGGGAAGGGHGGSHSDLTFQRHVPKFLQSHAHLLGAGQQGQQNSEDPVILDDEFGGEKKRKVAAAGGDASDFEDDEEAALRRALEENPYLADVHPELAQVADRMKAGELKERGNAAFAAGKHEDAAELFSQCIAMDPENEVYWSNRAASYLNLKRYSDAERDARKVVALKPSWVKGWARLGAALLAQEDGGEAREALQKAVELEPNDVTLQPQLSKAMALEGKQVASGQHKFKRRKEDDRKGAATAAAVPVAESLGGAKKKQLLSFNDDDDEIE
jgi:tetratricopeptide (TPR) repeat protein